MASVVIPAHDEAAVVARCLEALDPARGDLVVVVVANACTDATAEIARGFGVEVVETDVPGKAHALNLGDRTLDALGAGGLPRIYLDADVRLGAEDARRVAEHLRAGTSPAAAPRLRVDLTGCSWPVRAWYRVWTALPYVTHGMIGSGVYALSPTGRARFGTFPEATGDDTFVRALFAESERQTVPGAEFTVYPPRTLDALVRIKTRVRYGNVEHAALSDAGTDASNDSGPGTAGPPGRAPEPGTAPSPVQALLRRPDVWPAVPVYAAVTVLTRLRAARRPAGSAGWDRDATSRTPVPDPGPRASTPR
ncbi:glycosyltransferase [Kineococcus gynurae]|uniref:4,4'-diaponeurosporenoate glycosyltransferase n=1 Tax=Kineococcus gynurae TaxID=452979 RepID=A0ABV5LWQ8_9ACTN